MVYTTNTTTTYPITLGSATLGSATGNTTNIVDPCYAYTALPAGTSFTFSKKGLELHWTSSEKENKEYICNYCGTRYIDTQGGFIPNCKNCGAKLDKVEGE